MYEKNQVPINQILKKEILKKNKKFPSSATLLNSIHSKNQLPEVSNDFKVYSPQSDIETIEDFKFKQFIKLLGLPITHKYSSNIK